MHAIDSYDFRHCKACNRPTGEPRYSLANGRYFVYRCAHCRFHYIDHLDAPGTDPTLAFDQDQLTEYFAYVERALQGDRARFARQAELVAGLTPLEGRRVLDIGAGAGLFLTHLRDRGARVFGIEPAAARRQYAAEHYGLALEGAPFQPPHWWAGGVADFDLITLWDVIEHVNFPIEALDAAFGLLRPGGLLVLDTPARDSPYHRASEGAYRLTRGRHTGLFTSLYSDQHFAHKQIFHSAELGRWAQGRGAELVRLERFHELSRPAQHYLRRITGSDRAASTLAPAVESLIRLTRFRNKTLLVARKPRHKNPLTADGRGFEWMRGPDLN